MFYGAEKCVQSIFFIESHVIPSWTTSLLRMIESEHRMYWKVYIEYLKGCFGKNRFLLKNFGCF